MILINLKSYINNLSTTKDEFEVVLEKEENKFVSIKSVYYDSNLKMIVIKPEDE